MDGKGVIEGNFTFREASQLVVQLRYGILPAPLKVIETQTPSPIQGQESRLANEALLSPQKESILTWAKNDAVYLPYSDLLLTLGKK